MEAKQQISSNACLNCKETVSGKYCSNCGQKFQPTKLPLKLFIEDAVETIFNVDNRLWKTIKELFLNPGKVTNNYIAGERIQYVTPIKLYIWISVLYFVLVTFVDTNRFFLINISLEGREKDFANFLQYTMFLLLPVFAVILSLVYSKQKRLYVEHLIFGIHIHVVWYTLSTIHALAEFFSNQVDLNIYGLTFVNIVITLAKTGVLIYLFFYLKNVYSESLWKTFYKTWLVITLYAAVLLAITIVYMGIL